jgi:hypothetical protein
MKTNLTAYLRAVEIRDHVARSHAAFVESSGEDLVALKDITNSVPSGLYEHWESVEGSPKFYAVFDAGCEQDLLTPLVSFVALYGKYAGKQTFRNLIHPECGFLTPIQRDAYQGPRFTLVTRLRQTQVATLVDNYVGELSVIQSLTAFRRHVEKVLKPNPRPF